MTECPLCSSNVDIKPALNAYGFHGVLARGQGVRCRSCYTTLELFAWRLLLIQFAPFLLLVPFYWYRDSTVLLRIFVAVFAIAPLLVTSLHFFPSLYRLKVASAGRKVRPDDELWN